MKKFKKFIAIMLVAVLFAGTGIMDMGAKEVQAEETTIDAFDISVDASGVVEAGQDVVFNIHVSNTKPMSCTMNMFNHFYYENTEAVGIEFGELVLLGEDGEDDVVLTDDNLSTVSFEALQTKEFTLSGTLPESWNDESDITLILAADCTDEEYPDTTFWSQFTYTAASEGGEGDDEGFTPDPELEPIALYFGPMDENQYELYPGETVKFWFEIMNNTTERTSYTADFKYISPEGIEEADVKIYKDWGEGTVEEITDLSEFGFAPGDCFDTYIEWEVPESWEEGRCNFHATVTDGTNTTTVDWPGGYIETYEYGDVAFKGITIDPEYEKEDIQFETGERTKKIPVEFKVETKNGWKLDTVDCYYYTAKDARYLAVDVIKVEQKDDTTYKGYLEVNKYSYEDTYLLEGLDLSFVKPYGYDADYDGEITDEDYEVAELYYWGDSYYDYVDGEYVRIPATEEDPIVFYGQDGWEEEVPEYTYGGQANFTVTKAETDEDVPSIKGIELLTDPDSIHAKSTVSVGVDYEEYGSGVKEIELSWANRDGDWVAGACWSADEMEEATGEGSVVLSTEEIDEEWGDDVWFNNDEYYVAEIAITDWAGNYVLYSTENGTDNRSLINVTYVFDEEFDEYIEQWDEIMGVSFSRGGKHLYAPVATKSSERANAAKKTNGKAYKRCLICGKETTSKGTIYYPKYYSIDNSVYTGEPVGCGEIEIKDSDKKVIRPVFYSVNFPDNATSVGKHKVEIDFGGNYWGTVTKSYVIVPAAVPEVSAEVSGGHNDVKVSWEKSTGASGYYVSWGRVYYDEYGDPYVKSWSSKKSTTKTYYTAKDLTSDKNYMFRVVPYYKSGDTKYYEASEYKEVECKTQKYVKAPSSVTAKLNGVYNDVSLSWKKSTGADGYNVYYKLGSGDYELLTTTTSLKTTEAAGLEDGGKYTFKVVPYYLEDGEEIESAYSKTTTVYIMKAPGTAKVTRYSSSKVKVAWTNISGESGYEISKSEDPNADGIITTYKTTSGKSKTITAKKGVTYYYKVRAYKTVDGEKIYGPWTDVKEYTRTR